jgi:hypothetical protein
MSEPRKQSMSASQRRRRARIAAHVSWANTPDRRKRTSAGTKAFCDRFEQQVDPQRVLPDAVRQQLAAHARKAYMLALAEKSVQARRRRK